MTTSKHPNTVMAMSIPDRSGAPLNNSPTPNHRPTDTVLKQQHVMPINIKKGTLL